MPLSDISKLAHSPSRLDLSVVCWLFSLLGINRSFFHNSSGKSSHKTPGNSYIDTQPAPSLSLQQHGMLMLAWVSAQVAILCPRKISMSEALLCPAFSATTFILDNVGVRMRVAPQAHMFEYLVPR